jgi:hypothetical protein
VPPAAAISPVSTSSRLSVASGSVGEARVIAISSPRGSAPSRPLNLTVFASSRVPAPAVRATRPARERRVETVVPVKSSRPLTNIKTARI